MKSTSRTDDRRKASATRFSRGTKSSKDRSRKEQISELEAIKKNGIRSIKLKMKTLFAGYKTVTMRLDSSCSSIDDCFLTVNVENTLMSDAQLELLNPFTIKIEKITDLPNEPVPLEVLREKCEPVYCSYSFLKEPLYKTEPKIQESSIFLNDVNVFLSGLIDQEEFREYLYGVPFEIEIHDRNRKPEKILQNPCLFGNDAVDEQISSVNAVSAKDTSTNPFEARNKLWDPYGVGNLKKLKKRKYSIKNY